MYKCAIWRNSAGWRYGWVIQWLNCIWDAEATGCIIYIIRAVRSSSASTPHVTIVDSHVFLPHLSVSLSHRHESRAESTPVRSCP
jgi:hypothetical protein